VYVLVAAEIFLRVFHPIPMLPRYVTAKPYGVRGNMPGARFWHRTPEYELEMRMNSHGVRADEEIPYEKPEHELRVLLLGDSFAVGHGATVEQTFLSQTQDALHADGIDVQVVNMGVSGHGTAEQLVTLREEGLRYEPDLVVVGWHPTDLDDNVRSNLFAFENGELEARSEVYLPAVSTRTFLFSFAAYRWLAGSSHLYNWVRTEGGQAGQRLLFMIRSVGSGGDRPDAEREEGGGPDGAPGELSPAEQLTLALLREMRRVSEESGASFMIVDIPYRRPGPSYVSGFPPDPAGAHHGFVFVDPIPVFEEHIDELLYWERSHDHFTPRGNRLVGREMARTIQREGLLPRP